MTAGMCCCVRWGTLRSELKDSLSLDSLHWQIPQFYQIASSQPHCRTGEEEDRVRGADKSFPQTLRSGSRYPLLFLVSDVRLQITFPCNVQSRRRTVRNGGAPREAFCYKTIGSCIKYNFYCLAGLARETLRGLKKKKQKKSPRDRNCGSKEASLWMGILSAVRRKINPASPSSVDVEGAGVSRGCGGP